MKNECSKQRQAFVSIISLLFFCLIASSVFAQEVPVLDWVKSTRGGGNDFNRASVTATAMDASGNLYVTGSFDYIADFDPGPGVFNLTPVGNADAFILKLDSDGSFAWAVQFGSSLADLGSDVAVDLLGNVYFTGEFPGAFDADPGAGVATITPASRDIVIIKLNSNGNLLWVKKMGGAAFDVGYSLDVNNTGDVYITGFHGGTVDFDPGPGIVNIGGSGGFLLKLTTDGDYVWVKQPTTSREVHVDNAGNILLNGWFSAPISFSTLSGPVTLTPAGNTDFFIVKYLADGNIDWAKSMGGTSTDESYSITTDLSNNVYTTGTFSGNVDFDPGLGTSTLTSPSTISVFISKLDVNGNFVLAKQFTGGGSNSGFGIAVDASQNIYTTGRFRVTTDFDPGPGVYNVTAIGSNIDAFVSKLDNNGNFLWVAQMGGLGAGAEPTGHAINVNNAGLVYTTGVYRSTIDFDPSACVSNLIGDGGFDVFVQRLSPGAVIPSPTISSFSPSSGFIGTTLTLSGTNFSITPSNNVVKFFNGKTATVIASTASSITTTVPTGAITGPISVTVNCITVQSATNFIVTAPSPPTISGFAPTSGAVGTNVIITGTNFSTTPTNNTIKFNGTTAVVTASSPTSISTSVPAGATTGKITVTTSAGTATSATNFTVTSGTLPTITSFTPTFGPVGTTVTINGTNFSTTPSNNTVNFYDGIDSNVVTAVVTASTTNSITTTVPSGAFTGKIKVTTAGGTATSAGDFIVDCGPLPSIISFSPDNGTPGTIVTITGSNFNTTPSNNIVDFGGTIAIVTASTSTSITTVVPTGPVGLVPITITIDCNTVTSTTDFDVTCPPAPTITSFTPTTGVVGATVTITGTNFSTNPVDNLVDFNGEPSIVSASTATTITTTVPANAISGPINVYVGCDVASSTTDFIVDCGPAPTITSISPANGLAGTVINITGTNFSTIPSDNYVDFNGELAIVTASTATSITTIVPAAATTGPVTIVVACNYVTSSNDFVVGTNITITTQPSDFIACVGQTATFTVAATGTTNITYQWQFSPDGIAPFTDLLNNSSYSNVATATLTVNTTGNFGEGRYRCKISGDLAPTVFTNDEGLFINALPAAPTTTNISSCSGLSATLSATGGINGQYRWYTVPTGGVALGEVNSSYATPVLNSTTTYYVAINNGTCESTRTPALVTINALPTKPAITASISPVGNALTICSTSSLTLSAPAGFSSYLWATGATTQQINITTSGSYSVTVTNAAGCTSPISDAITITIVPAPCNNQPPVISTTLVSTVIEGQVSINLLDLISDADNNVVASSLTIVQPPTSGTTATIVNGVLEIDYTGKNFSGRDQLTIEVCDAFGECAQQVLEIDVIGDIEIYNGISPNGDEQNDIFLIRYIDLLPDTQQNKVTIYNRWGSKVFEVSNYDNSSRVFRGLSDSGNELPSGTYFYKIEFNSGRESETGFLSLKQ